MRFKGISDRNALALAQRAASLCNRCDVPLIINDRVDIAMMAGAAGVHLGDDDLPVGVVRRIWDGLIGATAHTMEEALAAERDGADYLGWGSVFPSGTKRIPQVVGAASIRRLKCRVGVPVVAIGGITPRNLASVLAAGADGIAAIGGLHSLGVPSFVRAIEKYRNIPGEGRV